MVELEFFNVKMNTIIEDNKPFKLIPFIFHLRDDITQSKKEREVTYSHETFQQQGIS